ncbi:MAG: tRNA 5-methoxyuridine(34)/uridine 5-oxyacetic acid(34) synthase CmoB [Gammaproteobacteria bacterium]|nr:tRNA 5-methoxyuridine(34)/uridine 5-oxyacetic acid(34) synthase CmoB [Gammaproteobacteria bacterium]MDH5727457.1 tRNA 5-methoxyuridine(34)/uridine 5-oxyacetic acid(34) synthase CmoB [Gammaproteobacteria bacterium]
MINTEFLLNQMCSHGLQSWVDCLPEQLQTKFSVSQHGAWSQWQQALDSLPVLNPSVIELNQSVVTIGSEHDCDSETRLILDQQLRQLIPWRKGPFSIFGVAIDTEWRSDWKWDRLKNHISCLENKRVLDVGCGSGYHAWRMLGAGASLVIGVDPSLLFVAQHQAMHRYAAELPVFVLPFAMEDVPRSLQAFDTVFSMGVLYHRRSPLEHLTELRDCLCTGGELVLETLVVEGDENTCLVPKARYAQMKNVWFIPSIEMLRIWLARLGFTNIRVVDVNQTSLQEQRTTEWMPNLSLKDFLDEKDLNLTVEAYPAPRRAIVIANRK